MAINTHTAGCHLSDTHAMHVWLPMLTILMARYCMCQCPTQYIKLFFLFKLLETNFIFISYSSSESKVSPCPYQSVQLYNPMMKDVSRLVFAPTSLNHFYCTTGDFYNQVITKSVFVLSQENKN